jgi:hypothetical protein
MIFYLSDMRSGNLKHSNIKNFVDTNLHIYNLPNAAEAGERSNVQTALVKECVIKYTVMNILCSVEEEL